MKLLLISLLILFQLNLIKTINCQYPNTIHSLADYNEDYLDDDDLDDNAEDDDLNDENDDSIENQSKHQHQHPIVKKYLNLDQLHQKLFLIKSNVFNDNDNKIHSIKNHNFTWSLLNQKNKKQNNNNNNDLEKKLSSSIDNNNNNSNTKTTDDWINGFDGLQSDDPLVSSSISPPSSSMLNEKQQLKNNKINTEDGNKGDLIKNSKINPPYDSTNRGKDVVGGGDGGKDSASSSLFSSWFTWSQPQSQQPQSQQQQPQSSQPAQPQQAAPQKPAQSQQQQQPSQPQTQQSVQQPRPNPSPSSSYPQQQQQQPHPYQYPQQAHPYPYPHYQYPNQYQQQQQYYRAPAEMNQQQPQQQQQPSRQPSIVVSQQPYQYYSNHPNPNSNPNNWFCQIHYNNNCSIFNDPQTGPLFQLKQFNKFDSHNSSSGSTSGSSSGSSSFYLMLDTSQVPQNKIGARLITPYIPISLQKPKFGCLQLNYLIYGNQIDKIILYQQDTDNHCLYSSEFDSTWKQTTTTTTATTTTATTMENLLEFFIEFHNNSDPRFFLEVYWKQQLQNNKSKSNSNSGSGSGSGFGLSQLNLLFNQNCLKISKNNNCGPPHLTQKQNHYQQIP